MPRLSFRCFRVILTVLALAGCGTPAPVPVAGFRAPAEAIRSVAVLDPARLAGPWRQVAAFAAADAPACAGGGVEFVPAPGGMRIAARLCLNGRETAAAGPVRLIGPGRLAVPGMADWWVIWVDTDYRTLAIATPDGRFGFVLDRGRIGPDRLRAAAEIFAFNGYDTARLRPF